MDSELTNRIKQVAQEYGLTSTAFADRVEVPRPVMSHIFSGRNRPSLEVIQKVGLAFSEVDLEWLVYGKGQMLKRIVKEFPIEDAKKIENPELLAPIPKEEVPENLSKPKSVVPIQLTEKPKESARKTVRKIVYFYDDNSFEEFRPANDV